jgi:hypothetical protein
MQGKNNPMFGKSRSIKIRECLSKFNKFTLKDYQEKYPWFLLIEELRDYPNSEIGKAGVQVRCKKCGQWFTPYTYEIANRIIALKNNRDNGYFYCSDECKNSCSLFGLRINEFLNISYIDSNEGNYSWRCEVLNRQLQSEDLCFNHCEICNSETNLHVHHEKPQKTHPHMALDPDNGIVLCENCHLKYGHRDNCSTGSLANKICSNIILE